MSTRSGYLCVYPARNGRFQGQVFHQAVGGFEDPYSAGQCVTQHLVVIARRHHSGESGTSGVGPKDTIPPPVHRLPNGKRHHDQPWDTKAWPPRQQPSARLSAAGTLGAACTQVVLSNSPHAAASSVLVGLAPPPAPTISERVPAPTVLGALGILVPSMPTSVAPAALVPPCNVLGLTPPAPTSAPPMTCGVQIPSATCTSSLYQQLQQLQAQAQAQVQVQVPA
eukprot:2627631-Prymnesium_polylepis.1